MFYVKLMYPSSDAFRMFSCSNFEVIFEEKINDEVKLLKSPTILFDNQGYEIDDTAYIINEAGKTIDTIRNPNNHRPYLR